jgi:hypothetical protein
VTGEGVSAAGKGMTGIANGAWIAIHEVTELEVKGMAVVNGTVGLVVQGGVRQRFSAATYKQFIPPIQTGEIMTGTTEIENIRAREEKITTETAVETIDDLKDGMKGASLRLETRSQDTRTLKITVITDNKLAGMMLRGFQKSLRKLELHPQVRLILQYKSSSHHQFNFSPICRCWPILFSKETKP